MALWLFGSRYADFDAAVAIHALPSRSVQQGCPAAGAAVVGQPRGCPSEQAAAGPARPVLTRGPVTERARR